ncbi:MAG: N-acetylmuramoyl-L-alanine amidase, partial [Eubacterium sp.]
MSYLSALNAGHGVSQDGSWDCGCVDGNYTEASLMLPITQVAARILRQNGFDVQTDSDNGNDANIAVCVDRANNVGADIYVSLHCDWNQAPSGTYPIVYPGSNSGIRLAQCLDNAVRARIPIGSRGILQRDDWEVTDTGMPACIFETGSISADISVLLNAEAYGSALACGIMDYFGVQYGAVEVAPSNPNVDSPVNTTGTSGDICLQFGDENIVV